MAPNESPNPQLGIVSLRDYAGDLQNEINKLDGLAAIVGGDADSPDAKSKLTNRRARAKSRNENRLCLFLIVFSPNRPTFPCINVPRLYIQPQFSRNYHQQPSLFFPQDRRAFNLP